MCLAGCVMLSSCRRDGLSCQSPNQPWLHPVLTLSEAPPIYVNTSHAQSALRPRISSPRIPLLYASSHSSRIAFQSRRASFLTLVPSLLSVLYMTLPPEAIHSISELKYPRPFHNLFFFIHGYSYHLTIQDSAVDVECF